MTVTPFRKTRRKARRVAARPSLLLAKESRAWLRRAHWVVPVAFTAWAWWRLGKLGGAETLAIATAVALLLWPLAVLWCWYGLPAAIRACWPREWRARHRKRAADAWRAAHPGAVAKGQGPPRPVIPARLERLTFRAYGNRCVSCRASAAELRNAGMAGLQWEHIQPYSRGGLTSMWNGTILCGAENVIKSDYWVYRKRRWRKARYNPWAGYANVEEARRILRRERWARANLTRWLAVAWLVAVT